jgi:DNA replication protein DnaC
LEQFDFTEVPTLNPARILSLAQSDWVDKRQNLILIGDPGLGKTHLAIGLAAAACRRGKRVRFVTTPSLVNELNEARANNQLSRLQAYYHRIELLVLDELGYVPFPKEGAEMFFNLCASRYERRSTLVTSNLEFSRWTEVLGDQTLAGALVDRLTHHAQIIKITGDSYRFRQSLRSATGKPVSDGNN